MKKTTNKLDSLIAKAARAVAVKNANSACMYFVHQPKMPEKAQNLRKF